MSRLNFPIADDDKTLEHLAAYAWRYAGGRSPLSGLALSQWDTTTTLGEAYAIDVSAMFRLAEAGYVTMEHGPWNDITFRLTEKVREL